MHSRIRVRAIRIAVFGLVALHAGLLAQRIRDLSIAEPSVLARWGAAVVLGAAALVLLRRRVSRRAWGVFWTAVLLLHAAAPGATVRGDVLLEVTVILAPLLLPVLRFAYERRSARPTILADDDPAPRIAVPRTPLAGRAPPLAWTFHAPPATCLAR